MAEYIEKEKAARILREEAAANYPTAFHVGLYAAARAIDSIPAADVRPVVRGRWSKELGKVETEGGSVTLVYPQCSECGFIATWSSPYCPHCGAMMEES